MTDRYALFGNPARHSKSPKIHAAYALETGQDLTYEVIEPPLDGFVAAVAAFAPGCVAYDLVYGKGLTPFLALARDAGARRLADGVGMLVEQAAEGFEWWRGVRPSTRAVIDSLAVPLD